MRRRRKKATGMRKLALALCRLEGGYRQVDLWQATDFLDKLTTRIARCPETLGVLAAGAYRKVGRRSRKKK